MEELDQSVQPEHEGTGCGDLLSIIVPVFNTPESLLRRCVRSILCQTYPRIELIIVDDGSEHTCQSVVRGLTNEDSRIHVICNEHAGVSSARNEGIKNATGEWLAFVDADDEIEPCFAGEALTIAQEMEADLVCGSVARIYSEGTEAHGQKSGEVYLYKGADELTRLAKQMLGPYKYRGLAGPDFEGRGPVAKVYRVSKLAGLQFDEHVSLGEDALFNYHYIQRCGAVAVSRACWYRYYQYQSSSGHASSSQAYVESMVAMLNRCEHDDQREEFYSRCGFIALHGVENIILQRGAKASYRDCVELLSYAERKGFFSPPAFVGYVCPSFLVPILYCCRKRHFRIAYSICVVKPLVKELVFRRGWISSGNERGDRNE